MMAWSGRGNPIVGKTYEGDAVFSVVDGVVSVTGIERGGGKLADSLSCGQVSYRVAGPHGMSHPPRRDTTSWTHFVPGLWRFVVAMSGYCFRGLRSVKRRAGPRAGMRLPSSAQLRRRHSGECWNSEPMGEPELIEFGHLHRNASFQPFFHARPLWIPAFAGMTATYGCGITGTGAESSGGSRAAPTKPNNTAFPRICRTSSNPVFRYRARGAGKRFPAHGSALD